MRNFILLPTAKEVEVRLRGTQIRHARRYLSGEDFKPTEIEFPSEDEPHGRGYVLNHITVKSDSFRGFSGTPECHLLPPHYNVFYGEHEIILDSTVLFPAGGTDLRFPWLARLALRLFYRSLGKKKGTP